MAGSGVQNVVMEIEGTVGESGRTPARFTGGCVFWIEGTSVFKS